MNIPEEAVHAASLAVLRGKDANHHAYKIAYAALEAAAPYLMAQAWLEGRNSQPDQFQRNPYWSESGQQLIIAHEDGSISGPYLVTRVDGTEEGVEVTAERLRYVSDWADAMLEESPSPQYGRDIRTILDTPIEQLRECGHE